MHTDLKVVLYLSIAISAVALAACLVFGPMLHAEMTNVWDEIDEEIRDFKVESDVLWNEMQSVKNGARLRRQAAVGSGAGSGAAAASGAGAGAAAPPKDAGFVAGAGWICPSGKGWVCPSVGAAGAGSGTPAASSASGAGSALGSGSAAGGGASAGSANAGGAPPVANFANSLLCSKLKKKFPNFDKLLQINQFPACQQAANNCPAGPAGPKGSPGANGEPGSRGGAGKPGAPGENSTPRMGAIEGCIECPAGPAGPPGEAGESGPVGMQGRMGPGGTPGKTIKKKVSK